MERITAPDGVPICVQRQGREEQPPVLVLPGGPCRDPAYLSDLAGLDAMRPLAVVHPRGTPAMGGLSRGWWSDAADVMAVADALGLSSFDVIAHSAGTRLALAVAARYPGRVRSMALITPAAAWLTDTAHDGVGLACRRSDPLVDAAIASMSQAQPVSEDEFQRRLEVEAPAGYARWTDRERRHSAVGEMTLAAASAWFTDIPADAVARILTSPRPSALVVGGGNDILSGVDPVRAYAEALDAKLVFVPDCGHYPWIEQPDAFRRIMDAWLKDFPAG